MSTLGLKCVAEVRPTPEYERAAYEAWEKESYEAWEKKAYEVWEQEEQRRLDYKRWLEEEDDYKPKQQTETYDYITGYWYDNDGFIVR